MEASSVRIASNPGTAGYQRRLARAGGSGGIRMPAEVKGHFRELRETLRSGKPDEIKKAQKDLAASLSSSLRGQGVPEPDIQTVLSSIGQLKARGQREMAMTGPESAPLASPSGNPLIGAYQKAIAPPQTRGFLMDALT